MAIKIEQPEFGRQLRGLRIQRGLSQRDVAAGAVNPSYISLLESGTRVPTFDIAMHLARVLDVPLDVLVDGASMPVPASTGRDGAIRLVGELLARSAADAGDLTEAQNRYTEAYRAARSADDAAASIEYGLELLELLTVRNDFSARYDLVRELVPIAVSTGVPELVVRARVDHAVAARDVGNLTEAALQATEALQQITETLLQNSGEHVRLVSVLISVLCDQGETAEVPKLIDQMLAVAETIGSPPLTGRAHWTASVAYARIGNLDRAVGYLQQASDMLANPGTPLRDWARFCRSAASALLDVGADLDEVQRHLTGARAVLAVTEVPGETVLLASAELRYALARGDLEQARKVAATVEDDQFTGFDLIRFRLARGRMFRLSGDLEEAVTVMRSAAELSEALGAYVFASKIWREIVDMR
jgi:transcriptional regulator with XRE-family HTH domain